MQGVEGQIFGPMARTYAYALIGAVIRDIHSSRRCIASLSPAGKKSKEVETFVVRWLRRVYSRIRTC